MATSRSNMDDIQARLDQMDISGSVPAGAVDNLASQLQHMMNMGLDASQSEQIAKLMMQMSLDNAKKNQPSASNSPNENVGGNFPRPPTKSASGSFRSPKTGGRLGTIQATSDDNIAQSSFADRKSVFETSGVPPTRGRSPVRSNKFSTPRSDAREEEKKEDATAHLKYRSGHDSPSLNSLDMKPPVPGSPYRRATSPATDAAERQPAIPGSPGNRPRPASRCSSPRPGLQDDDTEAVPASPRRAPSPAPPPRGAFHTRARSPPRLPSSLRPTRTRSQSPGPDMGDDRPTPAASPRRPASPAPPRHRDMPLHRARSPVRRDVPAHSSRSQSPGPNVSDDQPGVTPMFPLPEDDNVFTPPPQRYATTAKQPPPVDLFTPELKPPQVDEYKTGLNKQRRKGGTPPVAKDFETAFSSAPYPLAATGNQDSAFTTTGSSTNAFNGTSAVFGLPSSVYGSSSGAFGASMTTTSATPAFQFGASVPDQFNIGTTSKGQQQRRPKSFRMNIKVPTDAPPPPTPGTPASPMDVDNSFATGSPPPAGGGFSLGTATKSPRSRRKSRTAFGSPKSSKKASEEPAVESPRAEGTPEQNGALAYVAELREIAKQCYINKDYKRSIHAYTNAIHSVKDNPGAFSGDVLALLLSNRAAALLMIDAFAAAAKDCEKAITFASEATGPDDPFSKEAGQPLKAKILGRLGRAHLKLGDTKAAHKAFQCTLDVAGRATRFSQQLHKPELHEETRHLLAQIMTEATIGASDVQKVQALNSEIHRLISEGNHNGDGARRRDFADAQGKTDIALSHSPGSKRFMSNKLLMLEKLGRWREMNGVLERYAALNVRFDGVFVGDLEPENPFRGIEPANYLSSSFFGGARDEDSISALLVLPQKASGEAIVRMPFSFAKWYLRALRLQERYRHATTALKAFKDYVERGAGGKLSSADMMRFELDWLPIEESKLQRTMHGRERGDDLYKKGDYDLALAQYGKCLTIDAEGLKPAADKTNAGGRLHAVLHCNRAACLKQLGRYNEGIKECNAALRLHKRYMKAFLRRARLYVDMNRLQEAIKELQQYIDLVEKARRSSNDVLIAPLMFDGPETITDEELRAAQTELRKVEEAKRKAEASARAEAQRRQQSYANYSNYTSGFGSAYGSSGNTARERQEQWRSQKRGTPHWDSFKHRGPNSSSSRRSQYSHSRASSWGQQNFDASGGARPGPQRQNSFESPRSRARMSNHYDVLGVAMIASEDEIKKAFKKLALQHHPDKNGGGEEATERFRVIQEAKETLLDPIKRRNHDRELNSRGSHFGFYH